ncbi:MAG: restriction endonuclease subunit S [Desulfitobacteriia bacterium]
MSVSEWREVTLGDVCDSVSNTHPFEKAKLIFLNTSDVYDGSILHNNYSPVAEMPGQAKKSIKKGDILYSEIRPKNKRYAMVNFDASDYVVSTKFMVIRSNGLIVNKFLYLYLTSNEVLETLQQVAEARSGTFPQITFSQVAELKLNLPPIPEQKAIVATLSALDDMIELNNQINKTLEEMAQAIFKSWFVDFEPFKDGEFEESELGLIPKGWRVGNW